MEVNPVPQATVKLKVTICQNLYYVPALTDTPAVVDVQGVVCEAEQVMGYGISNKSKG